MSRRIEVELTSRRDDGSWTWRAAGAKQPKGVLDGSLLPSGTGAGDIVRVDADFEIDGIFVTAVLPPKARSGRPEDERIELIGRPQRGEGTTTTTGVSGRGNRKSRNDGDRPQRSGSRRGDGQRRRKRDDSTADTSSESEAGRGAQRRPRRDSGNKRSKQAEAKRQSGDRQSQPAEEQRPARPKARKLRPGRKHRDALIASLPAEQQVVAEQVARGGLAAVRSEIEAQNRAAAEEGKPEVPAEGLLSLAESLVRPMQNAEWRDRADAALAGIERLDLRDLRSVLVAAEDYARDAEAREVAEKIREGLNERVERSQTEWHDELRTTLAEGRVVRALRLSSRPPKAGAPLPPEIAQELTTQANAALGTGASQHRIAVVLEAVAFSPVRPYVVLPNIPSEPSEELLEAVGKIASRLPEVAAALGIEPSPPNARKRPRRSRGRQPKPNSADETSADDETSGPTADEAPGDDGASEPTAGEAPVDQEASGGEEADAPADSDAAEDGSGEASGGEDVAFEEVAHPA